MAVYKHHLFLFTILIFLLLALGACEVTWEESGKPNVILILTDDQGTLDLNCYGAEDLSTPDWDSTPLSRHAYPRNR